MSLRKLCGGLLATACTIGLASSADAGILIWDGAYSAGWHTQQWDMGTDAAFYYGSTGPSLTTKAWNNGNATSVGVETTSSAGIIAGSNYLLTFYINTTNNAASGNIMVRMRWAGATEDLNFDERNIRAVYNVDGVNYNYPVQTDADSSTWQKVTVDLTQTRYPGWPYVPTTWNPVTQPIWRVGVSTGTNNVVVDNISLEAVPEPASLAILGLSAIGIMRRRRAV